MADCITRNLSAILSSTLLRLRDRLQRSRLQFEGKKWGHVNFCFILALCFGMFALAATAEELPDPTRPPPGIIAVPESEPAEPQPSGLQSIIISKTRRVAIIDGETVELGGKHGDARLVEVNEGNVVLQGAHGRQMMSLFPDVKITSTKMKAKLQSPAGKVQSGKHTTRPSVLREER